MVKDENRADRKLVLLLISDSCDVPECKRMLVGPYIVAVKRTCARFMLTGEGTVSGQMAYDSPLRETKVSERSPLEI